MRPQVSAVTAKGTEHPYAERRGALEKLGRDLTADEAAALLDFLSRRPGDDALPANLLNALKNDVANLIVSQHELPPNAGSRFVAMFGDVEQDGAWRDYCMQFLGVLYGRVGEEDRKAMRAAFAEGMKEEATPVPGTVLLAMARNAGAPGLPREQVSATAARVSGDGAYSAAARTSALQVCAQLGETAALPTARALAADEIAPVPLRMSAIACVGALGTRTDLDLLARLANAADARLRTAAVRAGAVLESR